MRPSARQAAYLWGKSLQPDALLSGSITKRKAMMFALAVVPFGHAVADGLDYPDRIFVQNNDEITRMSVQCDPPDAAGKLLCHFKQLRVKKPAEGASEERIAKAIDGLRQSAPLAPNLCGDYARITAAVEALQAGKTPPDVTDFQEFQQNWSKQAPEAKADFMRLSKAFANYCKNPDPANAEAVARVIDSEASSTCSIDVLSFLVEFTPNYSAKKWQSAVNTDALCRTTTYSELYKSDDPRDHKSWIYYTKDIVTNQSGKTITGESCSTVDQKEHRYTRQAGPIYANCKYVEIFPY